METIRYRPNVAAIVRRADGKILIGERADVPGCWQFPQGGVKPNEGAVQALRRELIEEISLFPDQYTLVDRKGPYRYLFHKGRVKEGHHGQEQQYFLIDLAPNAKISIDTVEPEFRDIRWISASEFDPDWVPKFKREVYRQVFRDFFRLIL